MGINVNSVIEIVFGLYLTIYVMWSNGFNLLYIGLYVTCIIVGALFIILLGVSAYHIKHAWYVNKTETN